LESRELTKRRPKLTPRRYLLLYPFSKPQFEGLVRSAKTALITKRPEEKMAHRGVRQCSAILQQGVTDLQTTSVTEAWQHRVAWRVNEAAYRMGISRGTIYELAKKGELRLVKIAGRTLVPDSEIVRLTTLPAKADSAT